MRTHMHTHLALNREQARQGGGGGTCRTSSWYPGMDCTREAEGVGGRAGRCRVELLSEEGGEEGEGWGGGGGDSAMKEDVE